MDEETASGASAPGQPGVEVALDAALPAPPVVEAASLSLVHNLLLAFPPQDYAPRAARLMQGTAGSVVHPPSAMEAVARARGPIAVSPAVVDFVGLADPEACGPEVCGPDMDAQHAEVVSGGPAVVAQAAPAADDLPSQQPHDDLTGVVEGVPAHVRLMSGAESAALGVDPLAGPYLERQAGGGAVDTETRGEPRPSHGTDWRGMAQRALRFSLMAFAAWGAVMLALILLFRFVDPPGSALMAIRWAGGAEIEHKWVGLDQISREAVRAVVASEDGRFCRHWGIDPAEIIAAIERARDGVPRGASTITMQVAKNMFLWPSKSYLRKALEVPLTLAIEVLWPKHRILEVYLNVAEWGPGVFGIEAAARHHFGTSAARLSAAQAALLAVALPSPLTRVAGRPGPGMRRLARLIQARARGIGPQVACIGPGR
ncbi:MAG: monofunctional biosynthetic peptidoglycan transglycosylase [Hyphomicrobiaceae bacterium]